MMKKWICAALAAFIVSLVPQAQAADNRAGVDVRGAELLRSKPGTPARRHTKRAAHKKQKRQLKKAGKKHAAKNSRRPA